MEITAKDLRDRGIRRLRPGDIIYLVEWDQYYDIVESNGSDGMISDSNLTALYKFDVVRRTKGVPEGIWRPGEDG